MTQPVNRFRVNLKDFAFTLFDVLEADKVLGKPPYEAWGREEVTMILEELARFGTEVVGPLNAVGDREGCRLEGGAVKTPSGFREAWRKLYEAGWMSLAASEENGGQAAPNILHGAAMEILSGANAAFTMYPGLTGAAAELIEAFGTPEQKARYVKKLSTGVYAGTMCLTEPQAGTDVGMVKAAARKLADGSYAISGQKMFISSGDHDLAANIVHMVLARVDGAPAGTKGLSLFIVPKLREDGSGNDVSVAGLEHKMGIAGSSTCLLAFGDGGGCVGELLGAAENAGMSQMFKMMNTARIGVGLQGLGIASTAYWNALDYARERVQGPSILRFKDPAAPRVPILEHADVRRMLLEMKARVDGMRALALKLQLHRDRARVLGGAAAKAEEGQVDLLVPLVKAYSSDQAVEVCIMAMQVMGGAGYVKDHPIEQYIRDAKVFSIYEGTNHIQAMDLVGRKLGQEGGANLRAFVGNVQAFVAAQKADPVLGADVARLGKAADALAAGAFRFLGWSQGGKMPLVPLYANRYLQMMSETAMAWLLLEGARAALARRGAAAGDEAAFLDGKIKSALFFARNVLPRVLANGELLALEDMSAIDMPDAAW